MQTGDPHLTDQFDAVPRDPRARRAFQRISASRSLTRRWFGSQRQLSTEQLTRLYWLIRWIGPRLIQLEGLPDPKVSLMLAAAAADGGCRRIRCPLLMNAPGADADAVWRVLQDAGLDWLLSGASAQSSVQSLLVLAAPPGEQLQRLKSLFFEPVCRQGVLGVFDGSAARAGQLAEIETQLDRLGLHQVLPSTPGNPFWLAVDTPARTTSIKPEP
jgi:hypothetical protein